MTIAFIRGDDMVGPSSFISSFNALTRSRAFVPIAAGASGLAVAGTMAATLLLPHHDSADRGRANAHKGLHWNPDALLPSVEPGGARQAEWAAAVVANYDINEDGRLSAADARGAQSTWGGAPRAVAGIIARYDADASGSLDASEARGIGADIATGGLIRQGSVDQLTRSLTQ
ncbi:MAG: hypothetical protein H7276_02760 [Caulobacter sp.]|nr:hypothetical protein [Vitreoscilla sp.]